MKNKKAYYYTLDAFIALIVILSLLLVINPINKQTRKDVRLQEDLIKVISSLKVGEIDNSYAKQLINEGKANANLTILEQLAEFYAKDMPEANNFAKEILNELSPEKNIGIWFGNELIASYNKTPYSQAKDIWTARQLVSGIEKVEEGDIRGYSVRAFLKKSSQVKYFYFGGYVGDGNISLNMSYNGSLKNVELEIAINNDFDVYINDIFSGHYEKSPSEFTPAKYDLSSYIERFHNGSNIIRIEGNNLYIAGGYFKIVYDGLYSQVDKYKFPGIRGLINLYDSFYIPGDLNSMNITLHYNSSYETFLKIGNVTVYNGTSDGKEKIILDNPYLSSLLNYNSLERKTIPLRLGMKNVSYQTIVKGVEAISVTDLSGSMEDECSGGFGVLFCCWFAGGCNTQQDCEDCGGTWTEKLTKAKEANIAFINSILNNSENLVGLVGYRSDISDSDCHALSGDNESLINKVNEWYANGETCICCGINKAISELSSSSSDKYKVMVVMSDGEANVQCSEQGTGNAKQDAIQAACDAFNLYNITVYAVGFGDDADETTLSAIAECGNGSYYFANVSDITEIYKNISLDILEAFYKEQTISSTSNILTEIYPDSYINFDYDREGVPYGITISLEKEFYDNNTGNFTIPQDARLVDVNVLSYSGPKWTSFVEIYNQTSLARIFNLSSYGFTFTELGDPYIIHIPDNFVGMGNNSVKLFTGISPINLSSGSKSNKIVYTLVKEAVGYSPILSSSEGCNWNVEFEDSSTSSFKVPEDYSGNNKCYFNSTSTIYDENDAVSVAVYLLLQKLDLDSDNKIDTKFSEQNLEIDSSEITGIPFTYSSEIQIRVWN